MRGPSTHVYLLSLAGSTALSAADPAPWRRHSAEEWRNALLVGSGRFGGRVFGGIARKPEPLNEGKAVSGKLCRGTAGLFSFCRETAVQRRSNPSLTVGAPMALLIIRDFRSEPRPSGSGPARRDRVSRQKLVSGQTAAHFSHRGEGLDNSRFASSGLRRELTQHILSL